jgi:hypothetical protein
VASVARTFCDNIACHFWLRADVRGPSDCWPWRGQVNYQGYATIKFRGRSRKASHVAWEIAHGGSFPRHLCACHRCDNPRCVNPAHIWAGTQLDNIQDMIAKGRMANLRKRSCPQGHLYEGANLQIKPDGTRNCRTCDRDRKRERYRSDPAYRLRIINAQRARRGRPLLTGLQA